MEKSPPDISLVNKVKTEGCDASLRMLISRHTPLCYDICSKYSYLFARNGVNYDDVVSEKEFLVYKSALSYNPDKKTKFSTWLGNQVRYHCLNSVNKNRLLPMEDELLGHLINKDQPAFEESLDEQVDYVKNLLSQTRDTRVRRIFQVRYFDNPRKKTPWSSVAKKVGISTQTAINLHNKTIKMLNFKMMQGSIYAMDKI
jgi:RNA polymerase sigma factor (sigma-70 family)